MSAWEDWITLLCGIVAVAASWYLTQYVFDTYGQQLKLGK